MQPQELEKYLRHQIPLVDTIGLMVVQADDHFVKLQAPLQSNRNHLGTAFGGSLYSMGVLACYTWLFNTLNNRKIDCHVVIKGGQIKYLKPVDNEIVSVCMSPETEVLKKFLLTVEKKQKAQISLRSEILVNSQVACVFEGDFVSITHSTLASNVISSPSVKSNTVPK